MKLNEMVTGSKIIVCNLSKSDADVLILVSDEHRHIVNRRLGVTGFIIQTYKQFTDEMREWCLVRYDGTPDMIGGTINPQWREAFFHHSELYMATTLREAKMEKSVENLAVYDWLSK